MKWALVNAENIIQNLIEYDGEQAYAPPDNLTIQQVNDWLNIGDNTANLELLNIDISETQ